MSSAAFLVACHMCTYINKIVVCNSSCWQLKYVWWLIVVLEMPDFISAGFVASKQPDLNSVNSYGNVFTWQTSTALVNENSVRFIYGAVWDQDIIDISRLLSVCLCEEFRAHHVNSPTITIGLVMCDLRAQILRTLL